MKGSPVLVAVAFCLFTVAPGCSVQTGREMDLEGHRGVTAYFILGFLDEYMGRWVIEGDDLVERFYCNEASKVIVFRRQLERLAREQGLDSAIRLETVQKCLTKIRSPVLVRALDALYQKRETPSIEHVSIRGRRIAKLWSDERLFYGRRDLELAYVAGSYARHGTGDSMTLVNAQHKALLLVDLLEELGCSNVRLESKGGLPQTNTIFFDASPDLRDWLTRAW